MPLGAGVTTPPTRCSRRRSRRWRASVRCSSAAASSRRCACRWIPAALAGVGLGARRRARRARAGHRRTSRRARCRGADAGAARSRANDQLFGADAVPAARSSRTRTARRCGSATSADVDDVVENERVAALDQRRALGADHHPPPARRQHHRDDRARQGAPAAARASRSPPAINVEVALDRTADHPRLGRATSRSTLLLSVVPRGAGGVPVPAQRAGHGDPAAWRCRSRSSPPSASCTCSATASTTCR